MIKKLSLFFDKSIRRRASLEPRFAKSNGLLAALHFHAELLNTSMCGGLQLDDDVPVLRAAGGTVWRYFDRYTVEFNSLGRMFFDAYRAETTIRSLKESVIELTFAFFEREHRQPVATAHTEFSVYSGEMIKLEYAFHGWHGESP